MTRPRLLITGASGLIGRILARGLAEDFEVYGLDLRGEATPCLQIADVSDLAELHAAVGRIQTPHCIVHLAANSDAKASWEAILRDNIIGTRNVFETARRHGVRRIVFASTNHVTGGYVNASKERTSGPPDQSVDVQAAVRPDGDYATSKLFGEALARQYHDLHGIEAVCLRLGNISEQDDPTGSDHLRRVWLSHRDLVELVKCSLLSDVKFGIYYGISRNRHRIWDISNAERELGYESQDDAAARLTRAQSLWERVEPAAKTLGRRLLPLRIRLRLARLRGVRRSMHSGVRDTRTLQVQERIELQVYRVEAGHARGPRASLYVCGDEALRFDCLGREGHFHVNAVAKGGRSRNRIFFQETEFEAQIERCAFELRNNLSVYLSLHPQARVRRLRLDPRALERAGEWMTQQMLELLRLDSGPTPAGDESPFCL